MWLEGVYIRQHYYAEPLQVKGQSDNSERVGLLNMWEEFKGSGRKNTTNPSIVILLKYYSITKYSEVLPRE